jgi:hypothetical protein
VSEGGYEDFNSYQNLDLMILNEDFFVTIISSLLVPTQAVIILFDLFSTTVTISDIAYE